MAEESEATKWHRQQEALRLSLGRLSKVAKPTILEVPVCALDIYNLIMYTGQLADDNMRLRARITTLESKNEPT